MTEGELPAILLDASPLTDAPADSSEDLAAPPSPTPSAAEAAPRLAHPVRRRGGPARGRPVLQDGGAGGEDQAAEAVWKALEAFEVAAALAPGSRPSVEDEAAGGAERRLEKVQGQAEHILLSDFAEAQAKADKLLTQDRCRTLLRSGERLLTAAAFACCGGNHWPHTALARLPHATARRVLQLSLAAVLPDLRERDRLRAKVEELTAAQLASTRAYLEEVSILRSKFRKEGQPPKWSVKRSGGYNAAMATFRLGPTDHYIWDCLESLPEDIRNLSCAILLEKLRCLSTVSHESVEAEIAALARRVGQARASGPSGEAHGGEAEQQQQQQDAGELRRCQKELAKTKRMHQELEQRFREQVSTVQSLQNELSMLHSKATERSEDAELYRQAQFRAQHLENELARARNDGGEEGKRLRAALGDAQAQLAEAKEAARAIERELKRKVSLLVPEGFSEEKVPAIDDVIGVVIPNFLDRASDIFGDAPAMDWLKDTMASVSAFAAETRTVRAGLDEERRAAERQVQTAQSRIAELEASLQAERKTRAALEAEAEELRKRVQALQEASKQQEQTRQRTKHGTKEGADGGFFFLGPEEIEATEHYKLLHTHFEELTKLHEKLLGELELLQTQVAKKSERTAAAEKDKAEAEALANDELKTAKARMIQLSSENESLRTQIDACERNQLHPSRVAELLAELKRAKHELQASLSANTVLRSSLEQVRQQVEAAHRRDTNATDEKLRFTMGACDRTVFSRLYEDAIRRHEKISEILRGLAAAPAGTYAGDGEPEFAGLPGYVPFRVRSTAARSLSEPDIREMMVSNARDLRGLIGRLFDEPVRPPAPRPAERVPLETPVVTPSLPASPAPRGSARGSPEPGGGERPVSATGGAGRAASMGSQGQRPTLSDPERPLTAGSRGAGGRWPSVVTAVPSAAPPEAAAGRPPAEALLPSTRPKSASATHSAWSGSRLPPTPRSPATWRPLTAGSPRNAAMGGAALRRFHAGGLSARGASAMRRAN